jgi:hypothetical protein
MEGWGSMGVTGEILKRSMQVCILVRSSTTTFLMDLRTSSFSFSTSIMDMFLAALDHVLVGGQVRVDLHLILIDWFGNMNGIGVEGGMVQPLTLAQSSANSRMQSWALNLVGVMIGKLMMDGILMSLGGKGKFGSGGGGTFIG